LSFGITNVTLPGPFQTAAQVTLASPFITETGPQSGISSEHASLITLANVTALYPQLNELAADSFQALRAEVMAQTGWDALGNLENAFVPLTTPLDPGLGEDWLYTGRAFTFNPVLVQANWMAVVREDFGHQIYWRIYLHTAAQEGSQGMPLTQVPWDFTARANSSSAYENGGQLMNSVPGGYWLDLTTYYAGAHFNELVYQQGLDWHTAMLQLYPPEVLVTPTIISPPTRTPTRTPLWYRSPTPTKTPTLRYTTTP
jgi:TolB protein